MPGFMLIRVSSQSLWVRGVQALTEWKNKSPVQSWLSSSLMGEAALEESGSVSTAVDLLFCEHMGTWYFQHPRHYLLFTAPRHVESAFTCCHFHQAKNFFLYHCSCSDCWLRANLECHELP